MNSVTFLKLQKGSIYGTEFQPLNENNIIDFSSDRIAVIYGANGAGKTTLTKILSNEPETDFEVSIGGTIYSSRTINPFHVISDQLGRNIISGSAREYFLGDNIRREFELKDKIDGAFKTIFDEKLTQKLSERFKISTKSNPLIKLISNKEIKDYVTALVNKQNKGESIDRKAFLTFVKSRQACEIPSYSTEELNFILYDYSKGKDSIVKKIIETKESEIKQSCDYRKIDEHDDAIKILQKYNYLDDCVVCDSTVNLKEKLENKQTNRVVIFESLDEVTKRIMTEIIDKLDSSDPFAIRSTFLDAIKDGNKAPLRELQTKFKEYFTVLNLEVENLFFSCVDQSDILALTEEYQSLLSAKPEIKQDDLLYIEQVVNESIDRVIKVDRDSANNIKIFIDDKELLGAQRDDLYLSAGEQNFISLSFELLKAKNSVNKIIVIDDPISSFDSIYKNKIAFSLLKVLYKKRQIILTHNTDLIRLLEHQKANCFKFFLLNKTPGETNGFIPVGSAEVDILLHLDKFIELLRNNIESAVQSPQNFLISMIPFMRGYANIIGKSAEYELLTSVMHGYRTETININDIYSALFQKQIATSSSVIVSAKSITELSNLDETILSPDTYPLLNRTLIHSLNYLYLRLSVEKRLVEKYSISTLKKKLLTQIIFAAFPGDDPTSVRRRVFLTSKKTLLNEFNHFEGNMSIFQPAIDITNSALNRERARIIDFLNNL